MDTNFINSPIMSSSGWLCLWGFCLKHHPFNDVLAQLCCGKGCCDRMWCQYSAFSILSLPLAVWQHFLSKWACSSREAALFFIQKLLQMGDPAEHECTPSRSHWHWGFGGRRETGGFGCVASCFRDKVQALNCLFICLFGQSKVQAFHLSVWPRAQLSFQLLHNFTLTEQVVGNHWNSTLYERNGSTTLSCWAANDVGLELTMVN